MRRLSSTIALWLTLQGCQHGPSAPPGKEWENQPKAGYQTTKTGCHPTRESDAAQWLSERTRLCQLSMDDRKSKFNQLDEIGSKNLNNETMTRLILASCRPDLTPGLLRQALSDADKISDFSTGEMDFIALIKVFDNSNRILDEKNHDLKDELERTINGIRDIETDLKDINHNGVRREQ